MQFDDKNTLENCPPASPSRKFPYGLDYEAPAQNDIFPREYPNDTQRRILFMTTMHHFKRPRNWLGSQSVAAVYAFVEAHVERWRMTLPKEQWEKVAADVHRILSADLMNGATQEGLRAFQADRGRRSGESRRQPHAERDADILIWVQSGASISETARAFGLSRRMIGKVLKRGRIQGGDEPDIRSAHLCPGTEPNIRSAHLCPGTEPNI